MYHRKIALDVYQQDLVQFSEKKIDLQMVMLHPPTQKKSARPHCLNQTHGSLTHWSRRTQKSWVQNMEFLKLSLLVDSESKGEDHIEQVFQNAFPIVLEGTEENDACSKMKKLTIITR